MDASLASHQIISDLLYDKTGQILDERRKWRIKTALAGIFRKYGITNTDQLVCLLDEAENADLAREVVEALLNNETYFFRDKPTFDQLSNDILPELAKARAASKRLSIWCAGCSTGQEAYSIAMSILENAAFWKGWTIDILGTDISRRAISVAQKGLYSQFEVQRGLSVMDMLQYFDEEKDGWQIKSEVKEMARFAERNVLEHLPEPKQFDLILCRNVLLYFENHVRGRALQKLDMALSEGGYLMLGAGETLMDHTATFTPAKDKTSLFRRMKTDLTFSR